MAFSLKNCLSMICARVSPGALQDAQLCSLVGLPWLPGGHFLSWGSSCWTQETCQRVLSCRSEASDTISALMADTHTHKQRHHLKQRTHMLLSGCHQINCCRPCCCAAVRADAVSLIDASHVIASRAHLHLFHYLFTPTHACKAVCLPH